MFSVNDAADRPAKCHRRPARSFVFGYLGGPPLPFAEAHPGGSFILAFQALPLVLTISALASLLFHWGVLQRVTAAFAWLLRRVMGIGGALALGAAVHVFVGMVEAPLLVRPYLARMQRGELFALMTCGMAGVAGTVMVIYGVVPRPDRAERAGQHPDRLGDQHAGGAGDRGVDGPVRRAGAGGSHAGDARSTGLARWMRWSRARSTAFPILAGIIAVLIVAVAVVALVNMAFGLLPQWDDAPVTLQRLFALPFRPVMWLIGVPWSETGGAATLMATKTVLNEFVAYLQLFHAAARQFFAAHPDHPDLCAVRLCQFRQPGHHDRRHRRDDPGAAA